jgi:hypothetical protein
MDLVALPQQELGQVGAVLARDAGNQCPFAHVIKVSLVKL